VRGFALMRTSTPPRVQAIRNGRDFEASSKIDGKWQKAEAVIGLRKGRDSEIDPGRRP
jgi:hypothetical protein